MVDDDADDDVGAEPAGASDPEGESPPRQTEGDHLSADGPIEDDLTDVVKRLKRRQGEKYNIALVNHPVTRAFLEAGMRLVTQGFSPDGGDGTSRASERRGDDEGLPGFHRLLTRKNIVREANAVDPAATEGKFRARWEFLPDFIADLVRYGLRSAHWAPHLSLVDRYLEVMDAAESDLAQLAIEIAKKDLTAVRERPATMRFRFFIAAFADRDRDYRGSLNSAQAEIIDRWGELYRRILSSRGLRLRPGLDIESITRILHGAMEGLSLQTVTEDSETQVRSTDGGTLLGTLGLAMIAACVDPGDGRSLEQVVAELTELRDHPDQSAGPE